MSATDRDDTDDQVDLTVFEDARERPIAWALRRAHSRARAAEVRADVLRDRLRDKALLFGKFEHILKSSFTIIAGWSRTLDEDWERLSDDQRRLGLSTLRRKAEETVVQAQCLLADVAAEIQALDLHPVALDAADVLRQAAEAHGSAERQHTFTYEGPLHVPLTVDPAALQQILGQLLENATKYSPPDTSITLSAATAGDSVVLRVADEGAGIPRGVALFQPFVRGADAAGTTAGSGLGLYIVRNLVEGLGGTITACRNLDRGSTFTITLPASGSPAGSELSLS